MDILVLSSSNVGTKSRITADYVVQHMQEQYPLENVQLIDLKEYNMTFSDGRNYLDYDGDNRMIAEAVMNADVVFIVTPVFQASIPATLKNVFDLLPQNALQDKIVGILVTAGSDKHFLVAEHQIKPILTYMKAITLPSIVFIEDVDFFKGKITSDGILYRIDRLIEDTLFLAEVHQESKKKKEEQYGF